MNDTPIESERVAIRRVRNRLALVWLVGGGVLAIILIAQSVLGKYAGQAQGVWAWALPTIMPALSLVMSVLGYDALREKDPGITVDASFFRIVLALSCAYLLLVIGTVLVEPFSPYEPLELLELANLWLAPFQALVISALGVLFFKTEMPKARIPQKQAADEATTLRPEN